MTGNQQTRAGCPVMLRAFAGILLLGACLASPAVAGVCTVPGSHATIQEAIDDPSCTTMNLSAQTYPESLNITRTLTLAGPGGGGAIVEGFVRVAGAGTAVSLDDLVVQNGCAERAMLVQTSAEIDGTNLQVVRSAALPCPVSSIFSDGFESGDVSAWSGQLPP